MYRKSESNPFRLYGSQRGLVFINFVPGFSVSTDSRNYGHDLLRDWSHENNEKVTFQLRTVPSFFPIEWPRKILPGQVCHEACFPN